MRTLLISGVCGFVGASLALRFRAAYPSSALQIVGFDNLSRAGSWLNLNRLKEADVSFHHADVRSYSELERLPAFDWVIDAAANPSVLAGKDGKSNSRCLMETNLFGTINLLEQCKLHNAGMVLLSTSRVYCVEEICRLPLQVSDEAYTFDEERPVDSVVSRRGIGEGFSTKPPNSLYGATKLASEQLAIEYSLAYEFPVYVNRCGTLAGAGQFGRPDQGIFAYWLHSWRQRKPLKYIGFDGSGHQVRDCLHPHDLFRLIDLQIHAGAANKDRIVNVSGGISSARSLTQLSRWCRTRWGDHAVAASSREDRPFDVPWMVLDSSRADALWGWRPEVEMESILDEIANFADANPDWLETSTV